MDEEIRLVHPDEIRPDPNQPRVVFDDDKIRELAETYKSHGVINPIEVDENNTIILGERRWRAAKLAGVDVPVRTKTGLSASERLERQLIDDAHREDLDPVERAWAYGTAVININTGKHYTISEIKAMPQDRLIKLLIDGDSLKGGVIHQQSGTAELARRLGINQMTIWNYIQILHLKPKTQRYISSDDIPYTYARVVTRLSDNEEAKRKIEAILCEDANKTKENKRFKTREDLEAAVDLLLVKEEEERTITEQKTKIFDAVAEGKLEASKIDEIKEIARVSDKLAESVIEGAIELERAIESADMIGEISEVFDVTEEQKDIFVRKLQEDEQILEDYKEKVLERVKKSMTSTPAERAAPREPIGRISPVKRIIEVRDIIKNTFKRLLGNCDVHERRSALRVLIEIRDEIEELIGILTED